MKTMRSVGAILILACLVACLSISATAQSCSMDHAPAAAKKGPVKHDYSEVLSTQRDAALAYDTVPGFTRSVYRPDYALITAESRVWAGQPGWSKAVTAHVISRASGAHFSMYMAKMEKGGSAGQPAAGIERFVLVLEGEVEVTHDEETLTIGANHYAYFPANATGSIKSASGAGLLIYERAYALKGSPVFLHGAVEASPMLPTAPEVFVLRKLLPMTNDYDFNVHVMDFNPGEYLQVKEVHYNQHGLLLLEGQGIYRLADQYFPVTAGDCIWMAPFVTQWYAALGTKPSRYVIYKDTTVDPLTPL